MILGCAVLDLANESVTVGMILGYNPCHGGDHGQWERLILNRIYDPWDDPSHPNRPMRPSKLMILGARQVPPLRRARTRPEAPAPTYKNRHRPHSHHLSTLTLEGFLYLYSGITMPVAVPSCHPLYRKGWYTSPGAVRATMRTLPGVPASLLDPVETFQTKGQDLQDFWLEERAVNGYIYELANDCAYTYYAYVDILTFYSKIDLIGHTSDTLEIRSYVEPQVYVTDLASVVHHDTLKRWKSTLEVQYPGYKVVDYHHAVVPPAVLQRYRTIKEEYGERAQVSVHFRPTVVWSKPHSKRCGVQWYVNGVYRSGIAGIVDAIMQDWPESAPQHSLAEGVQLAQPVPQTVEDVPSTEWIVPEGSVPTTEVQEDPDHVSDSYISDSDVPQEEEAWHASDADEDPVWVAMVGAMDALVPPVPPVPEVEVIDLMDTTTDEEDEFMVLPMDDNPTPPSTPPRGTGTRPNPSSE